MKYFKTFVSLFFCFLFVSCASKPKDLDWKGYATWNYQSRIGAKLADVKFPYKLSVHTLKKDTPDISGQGAAAVMSLLPIICLASPSIIETNSTVGCSDKGLIILKDGDIEKILTDELSKSNLFTSVNYSDSSSNLILDGSIKLQRKNYFHCFGLGSLIAAGILPFVYSTLSIDAHFVIEAPDGKTKILDKDYTVEMSYFFNPSFCNPTTHCSAFGDTLLPEIIDHLVWDLKGLK